MAAHITGAAHGGPRYDKALTSAERRSITNEIWCCDNCGRLVDADESAYTEELLRRWKLEAEARAARNIAALAGGSPVVRLEKVLSGHTNYVWDVVVTPDGRSAVSASNDSTLRV
jgi:WD40 repeat protein